MRGQLEVMMLVQSEAMVAKTLLVDDKITACVKQIYVKFCMEKHCLVKLLFS